MIALTSLLSLLLLPFLVFVGYAIAKWEWEWAKLPLKGLVLLLVFNAVAVVLVGLMTDYIGSSQHRMAGHGLLAASYFIVPIATGYAMRGKSLPAAFLQCMFGLLQLVVVILASATGYLLKGTVTPATANRFLILHQIGLPLVLALFVMQLVRSVFSRRPNLLERFGEPLPPLSGNSGDNSNPYDPPRT